MLLAGNGEVNQHFHVEFDDVQLEEILAPGSPIMQHIDYQSPVLGTENNDGLIESASDMLLPLVSRDYLIGAIYLQSEAFDKETFTFAQTISSRIASALDNAQLYQLSREQVTKLQGLNLEISALEQIKTDMIRLASHDLRNPIAAIKLAVETIRRSEKKNSLISIQSRQLDTIKGALDSMQLLIEDILSNERIEAMQKQEFTEIDLCPLVRATYEEFKLHADHKEHTYQVEIDEASILVEGDDALLHEVMSNFISNAIKYTDDEGQIKVHLYKKDDKAWFEVVDNGYGIPEDQQSELFAAYYRASNVKEKKIPGSGLGLHLTRNIVERLNGKIHFSSVLGEGSTFGFALPVVSENHIEQS